MTFLHKLYSLFDETIQYFDAYKVETIGDAYMVSSGVPEPTELHAANVCSFALELLENMKDFKISEDSLPNERVNIRIGIHSGKGHSFSENSIGLKKICQSTILNFNFEITFCFSVSK